MDWINGHGIMNYNISSPEIELQIQENFPSGIDVLFTDPPWGEGNLKYWKTINARNTGVVIEQIGQDDMEERIVRIILSHIRSYGFVIYGVWQSCSMTERLSRLPTIVDIQVIPKMYRSGSKWLPNVIIISTKNGAEVLDWGRLRDTKGIETAEMVAEITRKTCQTMIDPFCGIGNYLKAFKSVGFTVVGNEVNRSRLNRSIGAIS